MKKIIVILVFVLIKINLNAQNINNNILGYFKGTTDNLLYESFSFDNNGKVKIGLFGVGDYFYKEDSLIIFPDKSIFKFKIVRDTLIGASEWVKGGVWIKKDSTIINSRNDSAKSLNNALLLNEYYEETRLKLNSMDMLFDENLQNNYTETLNSLCNKGLGRSCLELFGMKLLKEMGGIKATMNRNNITPKIENPELVAFAHKIIDMGEVEGYTALGSYYLTLGLKDKALEQYDKAIEKGSSNSAVARMNVSLMEELKNSPSIIKKTTNNKKVYPKKK